MHILFNAYNTLPNYNTKPRAIAPKFGETTIARGYASQDELISAIQRLTFDTRRPLDKTEDIEAHKSEILNCLEELGKIVRYLKDANDQKILPNGCKLPDTRLPIQSVAFANDEAYVEIGYTGDGDIKVYIRGAEERAPKKVFAGSDLIHRATIIDRRVGDIPLLGRAKVNVEDSIRDIKEPIANHRKRLQGRL